MKKVVVILGLVISSVLCVSCTDNSLEEIENKNETQLQSTEPGNSGEVDTEDEEETGN